MWNRTRLGKGGPLFVLSAQQSCQGSGPALPLVSCCWGGELSSVGKLGISCVYHHAMLNPNLYNLTVTAQAPGPFCR